MATVTTHEIITYIEGLSGHALNEDEGVQHGDATRPVRRLLLCWMATAAALQAAGRRGADLVITHESLYYPYNASHRQDNPLDWEEWPTNRQRRALLEQHDLTLLRAHGSLDEICIYDDFAALLGLGNPIQAEGLARVYEMAPCSLASLVERVKAAVDMSAVRVSAPQGLGQVVRHVGLPWGGLGLFVNVAYQQRLIALGCDVLIAGESDDYGLRFAGEVGIPLIETGHEISEQPGLQRFAEMLRQRFPALEVTLYLSAPSWQMA